MLINDRMNTKYVLDFVNSFLKIDLNCVNFKNTCMFQRKMLPNLTCVFNYILTKCVLEDVLKQLF